MNEAAQLLLLLHTMSFGIMLDESDRYELGWSFIVFFALYFVLHGAFLAETAITKFRTTKRSLKIMKAKIASG